MNRRRFLTISAGMTAMAALPARAAPYYRWRGVALGAGASITLAHPDAPALTAAAQAEIARLEAVFSLYRADGELSRLNAAGVLAAPSPDLVECLGLCGQVYAATGGLFDPTIQPLWAEYAQAVTEARAPRTDAAEIGWQGVQMSSARIVLRPGMALTLNGIAQGFIADRVAGLLRRAGLRDVLVDMGEIAAVGGDPRGGDWPVGIKDGPRIGLRDRALATSAPLGTVFDAEGRIGHILNPLTRQPAQSPWRQVSISAPQAALADALSTAACLMRDHASIAAACAPFRDIRIEAALESCPTKLNLGIPTGFDF